MTKPQTYKEGIINAIEVLKDRTGSSMVAIKKYMQANLPTDKKWLNTLFLQTLKSGVASGDFMQTKGSYKLSAEFKKKRADASKPKNPKKKATEKKDAEKKVTTKKTPPKKSLAPKKRSTTKKTTTKKTVVKKTSTTKKNAPVKKSTAAKKKTTPKKAVAKKTASKSKVKKTTKKSKK